MLKPKPLSAERRAEIAKYYSLEYTDSGMVYDLFAAEQYWREAVKSMDPVHYVYFGEDPKCFFCYHDGVLEGQHEPDCHWLKAQE